jgi:hypothetical protein
MRTFPVIEIKTNYKKLNAKKFMKILAKEESEYPTLSTWDICDIKMLNGTVSIELEVEHEEGESTELADAFTEEFWNICGRNDLLS